MKSETMIVSDQQLTELIYSKVKGDNAHKNKIKFEWLAFTYQSWTENQSGDLFINKINKWLLHRKIPISVISFSPFAEDDESNFVEWEININL